jgi:hypothetical protein
MRRILIATVILGMLIALGVQSSRAQDSPPVLGPTPTFVPPANDYCPDASGTGYVPCPTTVPSGGVPPPNKRLDVSAPVAGPNGTTQYTVSVTTQFACFALSEPTNLYALTTAGAAAFTELAPTPGNPSGQNVSVLVDQNPNSPTYGTALLSLEVNNGAIGNNGLAVKAIWPDEQVERFVDLVPPATPTATATPYPGQPTPTSTPTPEPTSTPTPTAAAGSTPSSLAVRACVQPSIMNGQTLGGAFPTLYGLTSPGATCTAAVLYLDGTSPDKFDGSAQIADSNGGVSYPWAESSTSGGGIARISCRLGSLSAAGCTGFLILQDGDNLSPSDQSALLEQIQSMVSDPAQCAAYFGA